MKSISAALVFVLFGTVAAESCPEELPGTVELAGSGLSLQYGILDADQALCGRLVSDTEAWVGFGAQPEGVRQMIGARAVIALPSANAVQQYALNARSTQGVVPTASQSLTETSVTQEGGTTAAIGGVAVSAGGKCKACPRRLRPHSHSPVPDGSFGYARSVRLIEAGNRKEARNRPADLSRYGSDGPGAPTPGCFRAHPSPHRCRRQSGISGNAQTWR